MPRNVEANQRIRSEQRARIMEAARQVFARHGLAATIDEIAEESGVSHGLAYRYFSNKTALFSELVIQDLQAPTDWLKKFSNTPIPPIERIRQMVTGFAESRRDHPERYQLLAKVLHDDLAPPDLRRRVAERAKTLRSLLRKLIIQGQKAGEVAAGDPAQLTRAVFALLEGLTAPAWVDFSTHQRDFPDAEIFLRMLKP